MDGLVANDYLMMRDLGSVNSSLWAHAREKE
jgi:hypothetical protein